MPRAGDELPHNRSYGVSIPEPLDHGGGLIAQVNHVTILLALDGRFSFHIYQDPCLDPGYDIISSDMSHSCSISWRVLMGTVISENIVVSALPAEHTCMHWDQNTPGYIRVK